MTFHLISIATCYQKFVATACKYHDKIHTFAIYSSCTRHIQYTLQIVLLIWCILGNVIYLKNGGFVYIRAEV